MQSFRKYINETSSDDLCALCGQRNVPGVPCPCHTPTKVKSRQHGVADQPEWGQPSEQLTKTEIRTILALLPNEDSVLYDKLKNKLKNM